MAVLLHVPVAVFVIAVAWRETTGVWRIRGETVAANLPSAPAIRFGMQPAPRINEVPLTASRVLPRGRTLPETGDIRPTVRQSVVEPPQAPVGVPVAVTPETQSGKTNTDPVVVGGSTGVIPPIAPAYGSGILWGRAPKATAEQLAQRLLGTTGGDRLDSLTAVRLQLWIDSLAAEVNSRRPPSLTTTIGGKKVGVDGQWIYLGPIKIPAAILALLPINIQANPTQTEYNKRLNVMREDLYIAAQRAQNYAEFKSAVDKLRAEKQAEKEFRENQRGGGKPERERP